MISLYPRLGATVYDENGDVVPVDGVSVTVNSYYRPLIARGELLTYDPRDTPSGDVTPISPRGSIALNPKDYGARGDGVTNDTAAFVAMIAYGNTSGKRAAWVPPGTYIVDPGAIQLSHQWYFEGSGKGATTLKSSSSLPLAGTDQGVINVTGFCHSLTICDLNIDGGLDYLTWNWRSEYTGNRVHGIYVNSDSDGYDHRFRNIQIAFCTGSGLKDGNDLGTLGTFQSSYEEMFISHCAGHGYDHGGATVISFQRCSGGALGNNKSLFRIRRGAPELIECNGMMAAYPPSYYTDTSTLPYVDFGRFGHPSSGAVCRVKAKNCNVEDFSNYGMYFYGSSWADLDNVTFVAHIVNRATRGLYYSYVDAGSCPDVRNCAQYEIAPGRWGDPVLNTTDHKLTYVGNGLPYVEAGSGLANTITSAVGAISMPSVSPVGAAFATFAAKVDHLTYDRLFHPTTSLTTGTYSAGDKSVYLLDTTSGNITVDLPSAAFHSGRTWTFVKLVAANTATVASGELISGAGSVVLAAQWSKLTIVCTGATYATIAS